MKTHRYVYLAITCLITILNSCGLPYCKKLPFEKEDLLWLNPYEKGDILIFKSKLGILDTLLITAKDVYNPTNTFIFDLRGCNCWEGDNEFKAIAGFDYKFRDKAYEQENSWELGGHFTLRKIEKNKAAKPSYSFCELYTLENTKFKDTTIFISKRKIVDCIVIHKADCDIGESQPILGVMSFVWSKKFGLVQYTFDTGEKYEYFKKLRRIIQK